MKVQDSEPPTPLSVAKMGSRSVKMQIIFTKFLGKKLCCSFVIDFIIVELVIEMIIVLRPGIFFNLSKFHDTLGLFLRQFLPVIFLFISKSSSI